MLFNHPKTIQVALPVPFANSLTYLVPQTFAECNILVGMRVVVPFRNKKLVAIVLDTSDASSDKYSKKLRNIIEILDQTTFLPAQSLSFLVQVHKYYLQPLGEVVFAAVP
ncbi:Helicase PriA essential for oriC/DnaA-independent DNA replication, partial [hydrothermal vent metagenome]